MHDSAVSVPATLLVEGYNAGEPAGILRANHFRQPYGYRVLRPAGRRDWLLFFTQKGEGCFRGREQRHITAPGEITIMAPGTLQDYSTAQAGETWEFYWTHFVPRSDWLGWLQFPELWPGLHSLVIEEEAIRSRLVQVFEQLIQDNFSSYRLHEELAMNGLEGLLLLAASYTQRPTTLDPRVATILEAMSQQLDVPLRVSKLAHKVALSDSRLAHLFKEQVGDSIVATHLKLRLRQAARLLQLTNRSINDIALETGFQNAFYFSRQFKAYFGTSPSLYRKQQLKGQSL